ncbi:MAG: ribbon-helix-helix protein, CopG family, partial [Dermatophilaceae bacterium]
NFPAEDLALLDQLAARLGISRTEYLRRRLQQEARRAVTTVTARQPDDVEPDHH